MAVTAFYAAILALLFLYPSIRTIWVWRAAKVEVVGFASLHQSYW